MRLKTKMFYFWFFGLFLISIGISQIHFSPQGFSQEPFTDDQISKSPRAAVPHDPIWIKNDSDLAAFASAENLDGNGSAGNPYRIENYEISALHDDTISAFLMEDISSYVIIENLHFSDISSNNLFLPIMNFRNCSILFLRSISITNIENTNYTAPGVTYPIYTFDCNAVTMTDISISNCSSPKIDDIFAEQCDYLSISGFVSTDIISRNSSSALSIKDSTRVYITDCQISNRFSYADHDPDNNIISGITISDSVDVLVENCEFSHFNNTGDIHPFQISATPPSSSHDIILQNNAWTYFGCKDLSSVISDAYNIQILDNSFEHFLAFNEMEIIILQSNVNTSTFSNNYINHLTSPIVQYFYATGLVDSVISENIMDTVIEGSLMRFIFLGGSTSGNEIYLNQIRNGNTLLARDDGTDNIWAQIVYFPPLKAMTMVGNYWCDHNLDGEGDMHYIIASPRLISGSAGAYDVRPLHFFGMDFDEDGLNHYYELLYGTDINNPDTDGDGILDGDEFDYAGPIGDDETTTTETTTETTTTETTTTDTTETTTTEDPSTTSTDTGASDPNFWEKTIADPAAIGTFSVAALLIVLIAVPKKKGL